MYGHFNFLDDIFVKKMVRVICSDYLRKNHNLGDQSQPMRKKGVGNQHGSHKDNCIQQAERCERGLSMDVWPS